MLKTRDYEFWFITGSQHLYGEETLKQVEDNSRIIVDFLNKSGSLQSNIIFKTVATTSVQIRNVLNEANTSENCAGIITWMHTFSPAKIWIHGLCDLRKPLLHFHTQFNSEIPWSTIDMDFMNLNQSAHGDREYGYIEARLDIAHKVVVGHYEDPEILPEISKWMGASIAFNEGRNIRVARFGDNMRDVAVTDGDKIEAQIKFGWTVDYYAIGDLVEYVNKATTDEVNSLMEEYRKLYDIEDDSAIDSIIEQARIEVGLRNFLSEGNYNAFTTNFQDLHGLKQLPGLAVQHLMQEGYGFGGEGDWKVAALVRAMKIMSNNSSTTFMEDYTYNFIKNGKSSILGAHMLEVCPTVSKDKPIIKVRPLGIGGKEDPARIVFKGKTGSAICASLIDLGNRFRLIISEINAIDAKEDMPNLPVAGILWEPQPNLNISAKAWILAGGAHHTCLSFVVDTEQLQDFAEMTNIECIVIDKNTHIPNFKHELKWNSIAWK